MLALADMLVGKRAQVGKQAGKRVLAYMPVGKQALVGMLVLVHMLVAGRQVLAHMPVADRQVQVHMLVAGMLAVVDNRTVLAADMLAVAGGKLARADRLAQVRACNFQFQFLGRVGA